MAQHRQEAAEISVRELLRAALAEIPPSVMWSRSRAAAAARPGTIRLSPLGSLGLVVFRCGA